MQLDDGGGLVAIAGVVLTGALAVTDFISVEIQNVLREHDANTPLWAGDMMRMLRDEIPKSFYRADKQLRRDDKEYQAAECRHS